MDFTQAIAIVITGEFASSMVHTLMAISPALQTRMKKLGIVRPWQVGEAAGEGPWRVLMG